MKTWLKGYLDKEGLIAIENQVRIAEKKTGVEIVPMVVSRSSTVGHLPLILFPVLMLLYYVSGLDDLLNEQYDQAWIFTTIWVLLSLALTRWLSSLPIMVRLLVSPMDRESQAMNRATTEFYENGLHSTQNSVGILLFISLHDHKAIVLADKAIADKLPADSWEHVIKRLLEGARQRKLSNGFQDAIELCVDLVKSDFPPNPRLGNELANQLVIKD